MKSIRVVFTVLNITVFGLAACGGAKPNPVQPTPPSPVTPATRNIVLSDSLTFGDVAVGSSKDLNFSISNTGSQPLIVSAITVPDGYTASWTNGSVAPGGAQNVSLRFTPTEEQSYDGTLTIRGDQTGGTNTMSVSGFGMRPPRRGVVTDPQGDARLSSSGMVAPGTIVPYLVGATIDINRGIITITASFAPGTLSPNLQCSVELDTDENPATGASFDSGRLGRDYNVYVHPSYSGRAVINRWTPSGGVAGMADVTFPTADQARISFPMSLLDNDDGLLAFRLWVLVPLTTSGASGPVDYMPNSGLPAGLTRY